MISNASATIGMAIDINAIMKLKYKAGILRIDVIENISRKYFTMI